MPRIHLTLTGKPSRPERAIPHGVRAGSLVLDADLVRVGVVMGTRPTEGWVDVLFDDGLRIELHAGHGLGSSRHLACSACRGAGEFGEPGLEPWARACCVACGGVGLLTSACAGCGDVVLVAERDEDAWVGAGILVHDGCETWDAYFSRPRRTSVRPAGDVQDCKPGAAAAKEVA